MTWEPTFGGNMLRLGATWVLIAAVLVLVSVIVVLLLSVKVHIEDEDKPDKNLPPLL